MVLNQISACKGNPGDMIENTLNLGIAILRGGNLDAQTVSLTLLAQGTFLELFAPYLVSPLQPKITPESTAKGFFFQTVC